MDNVLLKTSDKLICWRKLTSEDSLEVEKWAVDHFVQQEPLSSYAKIPKAVKSKRIAKRAKDVLASNYSIGAYDSNRNDQLCAVCLMVIRKASDFDPDRYAALTKVDDANYSPVPLLVSEAMGGVRDAMSDNDSLLYVNFIGTYSDYGRLGIMHQLHKKAEIIAKEHKCRYIAGVYTSTFSQRVAEKLGYKTVKKMFYKDFIDPKTGVNPFEERLFSQHSCAKAMMIEVTNKV